MYAKIFSSIKKHNKKSNAIGFESVSHTIKIVFFFSQKRAYFFRISSYIYYYLRITRKYSLEMSIHGLQRIHTDNPKIHEYSILVEI